MIFYRVFRVFHQAMPSSCKSRRMLCRHGMGSRECQFRNPRPQLPRSSRNSPKIATALQSFSSLRHSLICRTQTKTTSKGTSKHHKFPLYFPLPENVFALYVSVLVFSCCLMFSNIFSVSLRFEFFCGSYTNQHIPQPHALISCNCSMFLLSCWSTPCGFTLIANTPGFLLYLHLLYLALVSYSL